MHENMVIVGILEESKKRITLKLLKGILDRSNYKISYKNKKESIIILNQGDKNIMIINIESDIIDSIDNIGFDFNILVHTFLKSSDYDKHSLRSIFKRTENIIVNCDENGWISLLENNKESIVVTYGFNNKATINPSSYNIHYSIEANICLQREMLTISGDVIEPFEIPIKINSIQKQDLYLGMAALTCGLILGIDKVLVEDLIEFRVNSII